MFAGLLAEIRAYGEGLVIAEQIPSKLLPDAIKNTAIKIVHRLPAQDDRDAVGATMNLTEAQSNYLVTLPPGQAAVFTDGMDYPVLTAMPDGTERERADVEPATASDLVGRRSITCGTDCADTPCTLRQIRAAQSGLQAQPHLVLWSELAVVAHLTGWSVPLPTRPFLEAFNTLDRRTLHCALSHAVDAAVASRSAVIASRVSSAALAEHVTEVLRDCLIRGERHAQEEPEWLAPAYRWSLVWDSLKRIELTQPNSGPHPESEVWRLTYGRAVPGESSADQLKLVAEWIAVDQRDSASLRTIAYGNDEAPAITGPVGVRPDSPQWTARLTEVLGVFQSCDWPLRVLGTWGSR
jgi:hypothetical protein